MRQRTYRHLSLGERDTLARLWAQGCSVGEINDCRMELSAMGEIARKCWEEIPEHFKNATLDELVIVPDHMHGIIILREDVEPRRELNQYQKVIAGSISSII